MVLSYLKDGWQYLIIILTKKLFVILICLKSCEKKVPSRNVRVVLLEGREIVDVGNK